VRRPRSLRRLLLGASIAFGSAAVLVVAVVAFLFVSVRREFVADLDASVAEQRAAEEIMTSVYAQMLAAYRQVQRPDTLSTARFDSLAQVVYTRLRDYLHQPMSIDARLLVEDLNGRHRSIEVAAHAALDLLARRDEGAARRRIDEMEAQLAELERGMDRFIALREQERAAQHDVRAARLERWVVALGLVIIGLTVAALSLARAVQRHVVAPLAQLSDAAIRIGYGDLTTRVPPQQHMELDTVAGSFNEMAVRIRDANAARDRSEVGYRRLFNDAPIPLYRTSPDGVLLDANPALVELLGYPSVASVIGADVRQWYVNPDHRAEFAASMRQHGAVSNQLIELRKASGESISVLDTTREVHDPETGSVSHEGGLIDVTHVRHVEEALVESGERFREMAEHVNVAFFVAELATARFLYVSPMWAEIWNRPLGDGYDPQVWLDTIHPDDRATVDASRAKARNGEAGEAAFRVVRPDQSVRWVRGRTFPIRDASGDVQRIVGVCEDITELRQAEERFTQAQKMEAVGRLAGGVAHDFNNLLTVIISATELVRSELPADSAHLGDLADIRRASESAATLTQQLLAFSRKQIVEPVVFNLSDVVAETGQMLRRLIGEHIKLEMRLTANANVRADRGQIQQVLTNLAVNARDAMPAGGVLAIETGTIAIEPHDVEMHPDLSAGEYAVLTVSDTGMGMTEEVRARAFEPFFTTKERGQGTGLGLATSHGIIKQAGGAVDVYSELNVGTAFRIYLPQVDEPTTQEHPVKPPPQPTGTETILMVEDEAAVRRVGARLLRSLGYHVLEANDGFEALRILREHDGVVHLLFSDVVLPGLGGRELAQRAKAERPGLKVLFASGYTDDVILQDRLASKDLMLLQKPYSRLALSQKVRAALDA
jgi:PAS domain S-box-containing protein